MGECHAKSPQNCIQIVPIFVGLTCEEMLEVAAITSARTFQKGDTIYSEGQSGGRLYVLHKGSVKISRLSADGKEQVLRVVGPGDFMGELSLLSGLPAADSAVALRESTMCVIEGEKLKELMKKYPAISLKVMEELSRRLQKAENLIESLNSATVEKRLAQALLTLSEGKKQILLPMTKGDWASSLGMSGETLSRKLTAFQEQGLIILDGQRKITILNREGLEEIL
jgi:CRP/FNR family transcriptional regulator